MKKTTTIPTILAIFILGVGMVSGVVMINKISTSPPRASVENAPEQVKITNISEYSFTVSWITQSSTKGFVIFGEKAQQLNQRVLDQRENLKSANEDFTHYFWVQNLKPAIKYYFKINSSGKIFDNNGRPYEVTTASKINLPLPENDTAYGIILNKEGKPAKGAIVYLSMANTIPLSSLVKEDGSWMIPLSMARSVSLNNYSAYDKELQIEEVLVQGGNLGLSTAINITKNDNPFPTLILGQDYDFGKDVGDKKGVADLLALRNGTQPTVGPEKFIGEPSLTPINTPSLPKATPTTNPPVPTNPFQSLTPVTTLSLTPTQSGGSRNSSLSPTSTTAKKRLNILNPSEGEGLNNLRPEFQGTAPSGGALDITVESDPYYFGQTVVDQQGNWSWTPPANLSPGKHTVTVLYKDESGVTQKLIRNFTVLAAGESNLPSFTSTPSATLTVTQIPTARPSRIITTPTATPTPYVTGNLTSTGLSLIIGLALLILGFYQLKSI